ncbi:unnamed protein product, partial [Closterium sp. NIES-53]
STVTAAPTTAATTTATSAAAATATPTYCTAMASLRVLAFDHEGRPVQFDTWLDDLQLTTQALYDAVVARYSSPATAALGRLLLPYLFPELSAFATVEDLVSHLCACDACYRAAVPAEFLDRNPPPMDHFLSFDPTSLTMDLLEQHLLATETSAVAVGASRGTPRKHFFEGCSPSPLAPSYASAASADVSVPEDVGAASASAKRRSSKGKGGRGGSGGSGGGGGGSGSGGGGSSGGGGGGGSGGGSGGSGGGNGGSGGSGGNGGGGTGGGGTSTRRVGFGGGQRQQQQRRSETQSPQQLREWYLHGASVGSFPYVIRTGDRAGQTCGRLHTQHRCFSRLDDAWRAEFGDDVELPPWADLLKSMIAIFDLDFDAILSAMYALFVSAEGECYWCVLPYPGIAASALGASESGNLPGTAPTEALHTFTLDSGASRNFFRDSTTLTPLPAPVPFRLADPSGGPVLARSSTVLLCPAVPSGSLSSLHLPSFSTNLVSTADLQDAMVTTTTPGGSSVYTLAREPSQVATSAQVSASGQVAASCSCRLLSHQTLLRHHRLGHPSLPRLRGMHFRLLVSGLPSSLPPLPPSPAPPCLPYVKGRQRAAPHSSSFPPTTAPLQTLHMDVWGLARVSGQSRERYFLLVVDDYTRYTTVFPLRSKALHWLFMEVARTSMIPAVAPHFLWPFAGSRAFVRDTSADKLSPRGIPCVFLGFVPDAPSWQFYHPTSRHVLLSQDVTFDKSVPLYRLFPCRSTPPPPPPLFLAPASPSEDPLPPQGPAPSGVSQVDPLPGPAPLQVAVGRGAARGAASGGAASRGAEPGGAGSEGAETGGAEPDGFGTGGAEPEGAEPEGVEPGCEKIRRDYPRSSCVSGLFDEHAFGVEPPGLEVLELLEQSGSLTERREPASRPVSPVRTARRAPHSRPSPVPDTHAMALRPSSLPLRVPLPAPPESSLPFVPDPESDRARAASPTCLAATVPRFASMLLTPEGDPDAPDIPNPRSYVEAITGPYSSQWHAAMDAEMASWKSTSTYIDEVPPPGANIVDGMWKFRVKQPPGSPPAFKARYVARGFRQRQGVDYFQTFSPTSKMTTLLVLLHVAAQRDYELHSLDFSTAFLQGSLHEEIWLRRPPGFTGTFPAGTQWSLRRPVYGIRQAPREWHNTLRTTLAALGFAPSTTDPSLFLCTDTSLPPFYVLVYVDDLVFATADTKALTLVKSELQKRHCTDLGELRSYLGLQITRDRARRTIILTQSHMVHQVLQRFGFQFSSPQPTPLSTSHSLSAPPSDDSVEPSGPYPELVGCLMYLMTCTRPDLAYPLILLARYVAPDRHRKVHWDAAKRVLRYLCSTSGMGLVLGGWGPVVLTGHADASWVDDSATQRSSQGYTFSLGYGSVSWQSTHSSLVLSSSCEAEILARAMVAQELRWLTYLLTDLGEQPRSHLQCGQLRLAYVATRANTTDVFTKALRSGDHQRFATLLLCFS